jgi:hypothetical protein
MLTPTDLNQGVRRMQICAYVAAAVLLGWIWAIPSLLRKVGIAHGPVPYLICIGLTLVAFVGTLAYCATRVLARCPACHKPFAQNVVGIVIATKHCAFCGNRVIADAS